MNKQVEVVEISEDQKSILRQLIELYEYDFSEYNDRDVNDYGCYGYKYLDHYWTDNNRYPYFVKVNQRYAGFVLVNNHCYLQETSSSRSIAEFFIMRKYRRLGFGSLVATTIFDLHRGDWEVLQHANNYTSKLFWGKIIGDYTSGSYEIRDVVTESWSGQGIIFTNVNH